MKSIQQATKWLNDNTAITMPNYVPAFDVINVFSCVAVIILHVNSSFWKFSYDNSWIYANIIETSFYWAVPVFFMISGATLIDYRQRYTTPEFLKKRFKKTFIPFIIWSLFVVIEKVIYNTDSFFVGGHFSVLKVIDMILNTTDMYIYWFFIALFSIYFSIPIISLIPQNHRKKAYLYMIAFSLLTVGILPLLCNLCGISMNQDLQTPISAGYVIYILLGYCITRYPITKKCRISLYCLGFLGWIAHLLGTHYLSYATGSIDFTFKGYLNLPCILFSTAVFIWFYYNKSLTSNPKVLKVMKTLSKSSFGIYLLHIYVLSFIPEIFQYYFDLNLEQTSLLWRFLGVPTVYLISFSIVFIIKKIPLLKHIVP